MRVTLQGRTEARKGFLNTIAHDRRLAGSLHLTPRDLANDGLLDVCMCAALSRLRVPRHAVPTSPTALSAITGSTRTAASSMPRFRPTPTGNCCLPPASTSRWCRGSSGDLQPGGGQVLPPGLRTVPARVAAGTADDSENRDKNFNSRVPAAIAGRHHRTPRTSRWGWALYRQEKPGSEKLPGALARGSRPADGRPHERYHLLSRDRRICPPDPGSAHPLGGILHQYCVGSGCIGSRGTHPEAVGVAAGSGLVSCRVHLSRRVGSDG